MIELKLSQLARTLKRGNALLLKLLLLISGCLLNTNVNSESTVFNKNSLQQIEQQYKNQPFLMIIWSTDCPPCLAELQLVGEIKKENPKLNLAIISTNGIEEKAELDKILNRSSLTSVPSWAFSSKNSQQLKHSIDPRWYGEMPRSYFYDNQHKRKGYSGQLTRTRVISWMKAVR